MFLHIVLFRPKPNISDADHDAMFDALAVAAKEIATVRRFRVGNRVTHGAAYESMMTEAYPFAAVIEFDDLAGLKAYLQHPSHERLGALFYQLLELGLVYDYEVRPL